MIPAPTKWLHHYPLPRPSYGDFLRFTRELGLGRREPKLWRRAYAALGGNFKGLQLFAGVQELGASEEHFLRQLEKTQEELNAYAAIKEVVALQAPPERELLVRLRVYENAVIEDGVKVIAGPLTRPPGTLSPDGGEGGAGEPPNVDALLPPPGEQRCFGSRGIMRV